jgi:hypothetical protein
MKPSLLLAAALVAAPPVTSDQLAAELVDYHAHRVDIAHRHETEEARVERIRWIADGAIAACDSEPLDEKLGWTRTRCIALVSTTAKWESALARDVHAGEKLGSAGERCLVQLHRSISNVPDPRYRVTPEELARTTGLDAESTARCLRAGVRTLGWHIHRCRLHADDFTAPARVFDAYHRAAPCDQYALSGMPAERARSYRALLAKLEARNP